MRNQNGEPVKLGTSGWLQARLGGHFLSAQDPCWGSLHMWQLRGLAMSSFGFLGCFKAIPTRKFRGLGLQSQNTKDRISNKRNRNLTVVFSSELASHPSIKLRRRLLATQQLRLGLALHHLHSICHCHCHCQFTGRGDVDENIIFECCPCVSYNLCWGLQS